MNRYGTLTSEDLKHVINEHIRGKSGVELCKEAMAVLDPSHTGSIFTGQMKPVLMALHEKISEAKLDQMLAEENDELDLKGFMEFNKTKTK